MAVKVVIELWHLAVVSKSTAQRHSNILKQAMFLVCKDEATESVRLPNRMRTNLLFLEWA
jgi:hypothetical protein